MNDLPDIIGGIVVEIEPWRQMRDDYVELHIRVLVNGNQINVLEVVHRTDFVPMLDVYLERASANIKHALKQQQEQKSLKERAKEVMRKLEEDDKDD